jgi:hypothetical protein
MDKLIPYIFAPVFTNSSPPRNFFTLLKGWTLVASLLYRFLPADGRDVIMGSNHVTHEFHTRNQVASDHSKPERVLYLSIYLSISCSTALLDLARFYSFLILYTVARTPWAGDQPVARQPPTHRINVHRHACLEWDSNRRSRCSSERRQFMAFDRAATDRPLIYIR